MPRRAETRTSWQAIHFKVRVDPHRKLEPYGQTFLPPSAAAAGLSHPRRSVRRLVKTAALLEIDQAKGPMLKAGPPPPRSICAERLFFALSGAIRIRAVSAGSPPRSALLAVSKRGMSNVKRKRRLYVDGDIANAGAKGPVLGQPVQAGLPIRLTQAILISG